MSDLIDKEALYNYFADLEAVALEQVEKHMNDEDKTEWRKWSVILQERTAYKHDVFDAPTVDAEPIGHGKWIKNDNGTYSCSECCSWIPDEQHYYAKYCLYCGAKMDEVEE